MFGRSHLTLFYFFLPVILLEAGIVSHEPDERLPLIWLILAFTVKTVAQCSSLWYNRKNSCMRGMFMPRFFVSKSELHPQFMVLTGENAAHAKVLRLKCGDSVTVCDGDGTDCCCTVSDISEGRISLAVHQTNPSASEAAIFASVYIAYPKADKLEHVIQKATELGAAEIIAFPSSRCVSRPDAKALSKKLERWQKIAASAAEQSGRGRIPQVLAMESYEQALLRASQADLSVNFYENEAALTFHAAINRAAFRTAALMTGPEGGYSPEEIAQSAAVGMQICTLGRRILRCETAPLCALSALMYAAGEF